MIANYDMKGMRLEAIKLLSSTLKKDSKWYKDDYESIVKAVNSKTRKELIDTLSRFNAVMNVSAQEIKLHSQL